MPTPAELLPSYESLAWEINRWAMISTSPAELRSRLQHSAHFLNLRTDAVNEATKIYESVAVAFKMPKIPIRMPLRIKSGVLGKAISRNAVPREIRIYLFIASSPHSVLEPDSQPFARSTQEVLETLIHECAHILDLTQRGQWDHGPHFKYCETRITDFLEVELPPPLVFNPRGSVGDEKRTVASSRAGCSTALMFIVAGGFWVFHRFILL